jgi:hypothetical protein
MTKIFQLFEKHSPQLRNRYLKKACVIDHNLRAGIPYLALQGKRLTREKSYISFRLGINYRLIYKLKVSYYVPIALMHRKHLEHFLKRR